MLSAVCCRLSLPFVRRRRSPSVASVSRVVVPSLLWLFLVLFVVVVFVAAVGRRCSWLLLLVVAVVVAVPGLWRASSD